MLKIKSFYLGIILMLCFTASTALAQTQNLSPEVQQYLQQLQGQTSGQTQTPVPEFVDLDQNSFSSDDILLQGLFLQELGQYLGIVGERMKSTQANISAIFIENANKILVYGKKMTDAGENLSSGESIVLIGESLELFGKSLFLTKTMSTVPISMSHIGQSISQSAATLKEIGTEAVKSGGRFEINEYKDSVEYIKLFYNAFLALRESASSGLAPSAKLKSNQALKNSNTTFQVINFDASSSRDESGTINSKTGYLWDFGDGGFGTGPFISHTFTEANTYLVKLYIVGPSGFAFETTEIVVEPVYPVAIINTNLEAPIGPNPPKLTVYSNETITFSGANSYDPGGDSSQLQFAWDFGDGIRDANNLPSVDHRYARAGTYLVALEVRNNNLVDITTKTLEVLPPPPAASFSIRKEGERKWDPVNKQFFSEVLLSPVSIEFDASSSQGALLGTVGNYSILKSFKWNFGDGTEQTQSFSAVKAGEKIKHTFADAGIKIVTLTVTDENGNSNTVSKNLYLSNGTEPVADFTFTDSPAYSTQDVLLFDASTSRVTQGSIQSYNWEIYNTNNELEFQSNEKSLKHTFREAGLYTVSLEVKSTVGTQSPRVSQEIYIESSTPKANFSFMPDAEIPNQIEFDASLSSDPDEGDSLSYSWDFDGDGDFEVSNIRLPQVVRVLDRVGSNQITLKVSDNFGKEDQITKVIEVKSILIGSLKAIDGSEGVGTVPLELELEARGFYNLSSGTDVNNIASITWDFGDGTPKETVSNLDKGRSVKSHIFTSPGTYEVSAKIVDLANNIATNTLPVYVGEQGQAIAAFSYTPSSAVPASTDTVFTFDASISKAVDGSRQNLEYSWDFGDKTALSQQAITTHVYSKPGSYQLTLTITDLQAQKIAKSSHEIEIYDKEPVAILNATPRQGSSPFLSYFDASSSYDPDGEIIEYAWDFGDGKRSISKNAKINHIYKEPGKYAAYVTVTSNNGIRSTSESLIIEAS
ncbi:MAG: PKD domain-containing protein [Candidatus Gracilibacteria bacterium]|nr:PKD domain-containing protein [Candidatus Gracilibacteria bacterium]